VAVAERLKNPPRPSIPIVVAFGLDLNHYLKAGRAVIAGMLMRCPVCGARLCGNGWGRRVVKVRSKGYGPPWWIPVHRVYCPACRKAGRHPWNFTLLPSFLAPRKHFLQVVRFTVFRLFWEAGQEIEALGERFEIDVPLLAVWVRQAAAVLGTAVAGLVAELVRIGGDLPRGLRAATTWNSWCYLALALRVHLSGEADLPVGGALLEWACVFACRRRQPAWSP
jgi:hypothetical protein